MEWARVSRKAKMEFVVVNGIFNADEYGKTLEIHFLPFCDEYYPDICVFQQDNAPAHTTKHTKDFFIEEEINNMGSPPRIPEMIIIENVWGIIASSPSQQPSV